VSKRDAAYRELLDHARAGNSVSLGRLLELYRNYLRFLARSMIGTNLRLALEPSDLVQETFLEAQRDFAHFAGNTEPELMAWLRRILARNMADQARHHRAGGRDVGRRESLEVLLERSSTALHNALAASFVSPSHAAVQREQVVALADALESLPEDYREVIRLRNLERLSFIAVAARMGRSPGAVRMLWTRAIERLSRALEDLR
jgi:RNA polymerase sigma-70 factor (ECF subfamily)